MTMLKIGNRNRTKESTMANEVSSRSHAVFLINVDFKEKVSGEKNKTTHAKLS